MKNIYKIFVAIATFSMIYGCQEALPSLEPLPDASSVSFRVEQDLGVDPGGNTVILISETSEAVPIWDYGTGKSNRVTDTIRFAFKGDYTIKYSALTGGGVVEKDPVTITVTDDNLSYVNDPLWTALSGGVGNEKTWFLDLNAEGISKYFMGPLYFSGDGLGWEYSCLVEDEALCWLWEADIAGNSWISDSGDFGSMTFSLKGGPFVDVNHQFTTARGEESGTYFLDIDTRTLTMTDAAPLQNSWAADDVSDWDNFRIISLTEDAMQLGAFAAAKGELVILNFISKAYSDNWVPAEEGDPVIDLDLGGNSTSDVISVSKTKTWSMSPDTPFDWTDLEGNLLNGWTSVDEYPDWSGYNATNQQEVSQNKIQFSSDGAVKLEYPDGSELEGTYVVDEATNTITFDGVKPDFAIGAWARATTTEQNEWKIVKTGYTGPVITDLWFGSRDPAKAEYMVFHFVLGSADVDPIELARKEMIASLTGESGTRKFKVSDSWHVDWLGADLSGGWTSETTFADDFVSNSWVWTEAVKEGLQEPRLTFTLENGIVTCTKTQNGEEVSNTVAFDPENNTMTLDMDLIAFSDAANWLPSYGPTWNFCKEQLSNIETAGMWLGVPSPGKEDSEVIAIHYVIDTE